MGTITHERPREKMYQKGVSALSNVELLQVIIGSGSAGLPAAKIARKVDKVLKVNGISVTAETLTSVQGLGVAKAGQIIAGLELANRLAYLGDTEPNKDVDILTDLYADIRSAKKQTMLYAFFDGNSRLIDDNSVSLDQKASTTRVARKLFGEALALSTASVVVAIGGVNQSLEPTLYELSLARDVYSMAALLSIRVKSFVLVGATGEYVIKQASHG